MTHASSCTGSHRASARGGSSTRSSVTVRSTACSSTFPTVSTSPRPRRLWETRAAPRPTSDTRWVAGCASSSRSIDPTSWRTSCSSARRRASPTTLSAPLDARVTRRWRERSSVTAWTRSSNVGSRNRMFSRLPRERCRRSRIAERRTRVERLTHQLACARPGHPAVQLGATRRDQHADPAVRRAGSDPKYVDDRGADGDADPRKPARARRRQPRVPPRASRTSFAQLLTSWLESGSARASVVGPDLARPPSTPCSGTSGSRTTSPAI